MRYIVLVTTLLLYGLAAHAEPRRWIDADGRVQYSDTPPAGVSSEPVPSIASKDASSTTTAAPARNYIQREADLKRAKLEKEEASSQKAQENVQAEERKHNCETARQNLRALEDGGRIATYDANGERVILDDDARVQRLEDARKTISANCN